MHELMKIVWEHTHDGIFIFNVQDIHTILLDQANPFAESFLKKPLRISIGKPIQAIFPREFAQEIYRACRHCLDGNSHYSLTLHKPEEDTTYWEAYMKCLYRNHQHQILFWCRDITASVRLSHLKETVYHEYDALFALTHPGIGLVYLPDGVEPVLERSNKAFDDMIALLLHAMPDLKEQFIKLTDKGVNTTGRFCTRIGGKKKLFTFDIAFVKTNSGRASKVFVVLWATRESARLRQQPIQLLTPREVEMLHLVCQGITNKSIAHTLGIAEGTVKKTLYNAYRKLNVQSRAEAVNLLLNGL